MAGEQTAKPSLTDIGRGMPGLEQNKSWKYKMDHLIPVKNKQTKPLMWHGEVCAALSTDQAWEAMSPFAGADVTLGGRAGCLAQEKQKPYFLFSLWDEVT